MQANRARFVTTLNAFIALLLAARAAATEHAAVYFSNETALIGLRDEWMTELADRDVAVFETDDLETFEWMYESGQYDLILTFESDPVLLVHWHADVPDYLPLLTVFAAEPGGFGQACRVSLFPIGQVAPPREPVDQAVPCDGRSVLERLVCCLQKCVTDFISALPDEMEFETEIEIASTPPGLKTKITIKGTMAQAKNSVKALMDLVGCTARCLSQSF